MLLLTYELTEPPITGYRSTALRDAIISVSS